jgi:ubiquitin carboxyl-terminal hydrolase 7
MYQIPNEDDVPHESTALALQHVFYHLRTSDQSVGRLLTQQVDKYGADKYFDSTNKLTRSFGWKSLDSFMQHDVQELNRVLQDKLKVEMKATVSEGAITKLLSAR